MTHEEHVQYFIEASHDFWCSIWKAAVEPHIDLPGGNYRMTDITRDDELGEFMTGEKG